jgi:hypothetical protein
MRLKFVGAGFLPGVPARDLGEDEVEQYGGAAALIASGLYEEATEQEFRQQPFEKADRTPSKAPNTAAKATKEGE